LLVIIRLARIRNVFLGTKVNKTRDILLLRGIKRLKRGRIRDRRLWESSLRGILRRRKVRRRINVESFWAAILLM
jgi:hypothetical protein